MQEIFKKLLTYGKKTYNMQSQSIANCKNIDKKGGEMRKKEWLRKIRKSKKMTLCNLADATGLTNCYLSQVENGKRNPSVDTAKKIAEVLEFDWTRFFK